MKNLNIHKKFQEIYKNVNYETDIHKVHIKQTYAIERAN